MNDHNHTDILSFAAEYAFLSNFYSASVKFEGIVYPTVEHAFQAQKTTDLAEKKLIAKCGSPTRAKGLGRKVKLRKDWESVKVRIMTDMVRLKFKSDKALQKLLLDTGDVKLIEGNSWNDQFWGVCGGQGKNWLGRILMQVRQELRETSENRPATA